MPEKIVFILSTSRTGTKALAEGLQSEHITSPHQPPYSRLLTIVSNYYLHGWIPRNTLKWLVENTREKQILRSNYRFYIQVYSLDYLPAKILSEKYKNVYIIQIVRDPRTFVRSYLNWSHSRIKSTVANKFVYGWHPSGFFTNDMSWDKWLGFDEFQRTCWHWKYKNTLLENLFCEQETYLQIRFEDLFLAKDSSTLRSMLEFLDIPYEKKFDSILSRSKNVSEKSFMPKWEDWDSTKKSQILEICGEKMEEYGYIQESQ